MILVVTPRYGMNGMQIRGFQHRGHRAGPVKTWVMLRPIDDRIRTKMLRLTQSNSRIGILTIKRIVAQVITYEEGPY